MRTGLLLMIFLANFFLATAQISNWQNMDLQFDGVFGTSVDRAYAELLKSKSPEKVIVAVVDSGIDTTHEDLKSVLWTNEKENFNGKDDDGNGYVDDINGWNFIGGGSGDVHFDNLELARIIRRDKSFFDSLSYTTVPKEYQTRYQAYRKMKTLFEEKVKFAKSNLEAIDKFDDVLSEIVLRMHKQKPTMSDFAEYNPSSEEERRVKMVTVNLMKEKPDFDSFKSEKVDDLKRYFHNQVDYQLNLNFDPRHIVEDDYSNASQRYYGNNNVYGPHAEHGTHVAGIIAAARNNDIGINGVANRVQIMCIRVVPDGDERDKDVANAIRYAVDNGARIVNMSLAKPYAWNKTVVDEAVKYAMEKNVLIVHAAGNDGENLDLTDSYPNRRYADQSGEAVAWIEVGASGWTDDSTLVAPFSNYGKGSVDVFAPGVKIRSTTPGSTYKELDGTSMAAPIVSGVAALLMEYYPKLSAFQVKEIILRSVVKVQHDVMIEGSTEGRKILLGEACVSGGIVNAYRALLLADKYGEK